jgi:hypothetical protein
MTRWTVILAAVFSTALAPVAWAGEGTCKAMMRGTAGDHLRVALHVERGQVTGADVVYSPPHAPPLKNDGVLLQLDFHYMQPTEAGLGQPAEVALTALHTNGGDVSDLAAGNAVLITDDGTTWAGRSSRFNSLVRTEFGLRINHGPVVQPELLDNTDQLKSARVEIRAADGSIINQARYDLSDHAGRDTLFHSAWTRAKQMADTPEPCG